MSGESRRGYATGHAHSYADDNARYAAGHLPGRRDGHGRIGIGAGYFVVGRDSAYGGLHVVGKSCDGVSQSGAGGWSGEHNGDRDADRQLYGTGYAFVFVGEPDRQRGADLLVRTDHRVRTRDGDERRCGDGDHHDYDSRTGPDHRIANAARILRFLAGSSWPGTVGRARKAREKTDQFVCINGGWRRPAVFTSLRVERDCEQSQRFYHTEEYLHVHANSCGSEWRVAQQHYHRRGDRQRSSGLRQASDS